VAEKVLAALGTADSQASIDAQLSERYHEVGFLITFDEPRPGHDGAFRFDTDQLQVIAKDTSLDWLKVSVCAEDSEMFNRLEIDGTIEGRPPADNTSERPWCRIWRLGIADSPLTISVRSPVLPMTGLPAAPAVIVGLVLLAGGFVILRRDRSTDAT
jgi:LPXTG-motif cell wall-anchored protein